MVPSYQRIKLSLLIFLSLSAGCELGFTNEADDDPLPFFPSGSGNFINVPANQNCSFYFANELHVNYLRCDGTWESQSLSNVIEVTSGWSISQLSIKVCRIMFHDNILMSSSDRVLILGCETDLLSDTGTFSSC